MKKLNMKVVCVVVLFALLLPASHAQSFLTNGLVAYYPFNGNASDASGNGNNGTIYGGVVPALDRFGYPDSAYAFNGVDGYIDIGQPAGTNPTQLTESAWVLIISRASYAEPVSPPRDAIMTQRQNALDGSSWPTLAIVSSGSSAGAGEIAVEAPFYDNDCIGTTLTPTNVWVFICEVCSNGTYQLFINGHLENTITDSHLPSSSANMRLMDSGGATGFCNGILDDVRIYNRALSSNEVAMLYSFQTGGFCSPHAAEATAQVVNGFMVGATLTDIGCGYTNAPLVLIQGGGGSGAIATATIQNGFVTSINIINPGSGYTNLPDILIASPPFVPTLSINVSRVMVTLHVVLGLNYILESSTDMINWIPTGPQFTAQSEVITNEFAVNQTGQFFRVRQVP